MTPQATTTPVRIDNLTSATKDQDNFHGVDLILRPSALYFSYQEFLTPSGGRDRRVLVSKADNANYDNWARIGESDPDRPAATSDHCCHWPGRLWAGPGSRSDNFMYYAMRDGSSSATDYTFLKLDLDTADWIPIAIPYTAGSSVLESVIAWDTGDQIVFGYRRGTSLFFTMYDEIGGAWSAPQTLETFAFATFHHFEIMVTTDPSGKACYNFFWLHGSSNFFNNVSPGTRTWLHRAWVWNPLTSAYELSITTTVHSQTHIPFVNDILDDSFHYGGIDPDNGHMVIPYDRFGPGPHNNTAQPYVLDMTLPYIDGGGVYVPPSVTDILVNDLSTQPILQGQGAANPDTQSTESCLVWDGGNVIQTWVQEATPPTNPDSTILGQIYFARRTAGTWGAMEWLWDEPNNLPADAPPAPNTSDWFFNNIFCVSLPNNRIGATALMFNYPDFVERFIWIISGSVRTRVRAYIGLFASADMPLA
jgi:hypothetical protein